MIVDSPGVGDSDAMNEVVRSYLPNAFCFIYVINSINAGGVQENRVGEYLFIVPSSFFRHCGSRC